MTQKYLVDYQCYSSEEVDKRIGAVKTYNRYTFSRSPDESAVRKAINSHKEKGDQILRAWVIEWKDLSAKHKLVIGDPANSPAEPGTYYLKGIRNLHNKQVKDNVLPLTDQRIRANREAKVQERIDKLAADESKAPDPPPQPEVKLYKPYPDPIEAG